MFTDAICRRPLHGEPEGLGRRAVKLPGNVQTVDLAAGCPDVAGLVMGTLQQTVKLERVFRMQQSAGMAKNKRKRALKTILKLPDLE